MTLLHCQHQCETGHVRPSTEVEQDQALCPRRWQNGEKKKKPSGDLGWFARLREAVPVGAGFEATRNLAKWLSLSSLLGIVAGLGAIALSLGIRVATDGLLGRIVGYLPPAPIGEGSPQVLPITRP